MKKILHVEHDLILSDNIAIVGSSAKLRITNYGSLIDSYDDVIRFNRAPTQGFRNITGTKTTLYVVNNHVFGNVDAHKDGFTRQPQYFVKNLINQRILYIGPDLQPWSERRQHTNTSCKLFLYDYSFTDSLKERFDFNSNKNPGVGMTFIFLCLISGLRPNLFGFDLEDRRRDHYWEKINIGPCHDHSKEREVLLRLQEQELVRVF